MRRTALPLLCLVLAAGLGAMLYQNYASQQQRTALYDALELEARPYTREINALNDEKAALLQGSTMTQGNETAEILVGFVLHSPEDLAYAQEQAETYGFSPVILLDCTDELSALQAVMCALDREDEIMLYASAFSQAVYERLPEVISALQAQGLAHCGLFLLRAADLSEENLQLLVEAGFAGCSMQSEASASGQREDGFVYFDYSFLHTAEGDVTTRLASLYNSAGSALFYFDLADLADGTITDAYAQSALQAMAQYAALEGCSFSSAGAVLAELSLYNEEQAAWEAAAELRLQEIEAELAALQEMVAEIYARTP